VICYTVQSQKNTFAVLERYATVKLSAVCLFNGIIRFVYVLERMSSVVVMLGFRNRVKLWWCVLQSTAE